MSFRPRRNEPVDEREASRRGFSGLSFGDLLPQFCKVHVHKTDEDTGMTAHGDFTLGHADAMAEDEKNPGAGHDKPVTMIIQGGENAPVHYRVEIAPKWDEWKE